MSKRANQFIVNRNNLNVIMKGRNYSDQGVAEEIALLLGCSAKSAAVRIGSIRTGKTISTDIVFLSTLEIVLNVTKGTLTGARVHKHELEKMVKLKKRQSILIQNEIQKRLEINPKATSIEVSRKLLEQILVLL